MVSVWMSRSTESTNSWVCTMTTWYTPRCWAEQHFDILAKRPWRLLSLATHDLWWFAPVLVHLDGQQPPSNIGRYYAQLSRQPTYQRVAGHGDIFYGKSRFHPPPQKQTGRLHLFLPAVDWLLVTTDSIPDKSSCYSCPSWSDSGTNVFALDFVNPVIHDHDNFFCCEIAVGKEWPGSDATVGVALATTPRKTVIAFRTSDWSHWA